MAKSQKKTGKGRLDKYYKLAKCVYQRLFWFLYPILSCKRAGLPSALGI